MYFENIVFDFDGTLVDTSEGIIKCMHYAFDKLGKERVPDQTIQLTIGPPLDEMFAILFRTSDETLIAAGVSYFRERYSKEGLKELRLYPKINELLANLKSINKSIYIVTSKPTRYTEIILDDFNIRDYFTEINGTELHQKSLSKSERLQNLIRQQNLNAQETVMIGDRIEDILAAKFNDIASIGVTYGFGEKEDLIRAGACKVFNNVWEIDSFFK